MTLKIRLISNDRDLYCLPSGQTDPRPVYLWLDCPGGEAGMEYNRAPGNAMPMNVWHHLALRWKLMGTTPTAKGANELLERLRPLLERVAAGHTVMRDGPDDVGRLDADATRASDEIESILRSWKWDASNSIRANDAAL